VAAWTALLAPHFDPSVFETFALGGIWAMVYFQGRQKSCVSQ
jgi:hypothetical protein